MRKVSVVIERNQSAFHVGIKDLWAYRELLYFLAWRDIKVRYKQTSIGILWAVLQPLLTIAIFTVVFAKFAKIPSDGFPYPVFALAALLPWTYFSQAVARSSSSVVSNANLITKVYFPRLMVPLAATMAPGVDFFVSFFILIGLMAYYGITPTWAILVLPVLMLFTLLTALAVSLWLSATYVRYRDVGHVIPFLTQFWMYASPVAYPVSIVPEKWRLLYSLNPMVGVIEGFRWALLGKEFPNITAMAVSACMVFVIAIGGVIYFKKMERTFADKV